MTTKRIDQNDKTFVKNRLIPKWNAAKFVNSSAMDVILGPSPNIYIEHSDMKDLVIAHIN